MQFKVAYIETHSKMAATPKPNLILQPCEFIYTVESLELVVAQF